MKILFFFESVKQLPIRISKLIVDYNANEFFKKYRIVSYFSRDKEKNVAYEHLADVPFLSVTGIRGRWDGSNDASVRFFVLTEVHNESEVLNSLRAYDEIRAMPDNLDDYDENIKKRIFASLAINSLGKKRTGKMMYNNGSLLLCDEMNFYTEEYRQELTCIKISVNEYLNLTAQTTSFSHPYKKDVLAKFCDCIFQYGSDIDGTKWSGGYLKPVIYRKIKDKDISLESLYIKKKRNKETKNNIPYWPCDPEKYTRGKLFAICQVVESVNEEFANIINLSFQEVNLIHYDECRTEKDTEKFLREFYADKTIYIDNPFKRNPEVDEVIQSFKEETFKATKTEIKFVSKPSDNVLVLRFCEPEKEKVEQSLYSQSIDRMSRSTTPLQHLIFHDNKKLDSMPKAKARRILMELLIKHSICQGNAPESLCRYTDGWEFFRYKIHDDFIKGASLQINECKLTFKDYGLGADDLGEEPKYFIKSKLLYSDYRKIYGARDYKALKKGGNTYLIIDTDEIPILDTEKIDNGYLKVLTEEDTPLAFFKRKKESHDYLRGYVGFNVWKSEGLEGSVYDSYSYISGHNNSMIQFKAINNIERMPRVRRIFVLHASDEERIENDIMEIVNMMKYGFGRWNEMETYPIAFKLLLEYLDNACEIACQKHWSEITYKTRKEK